MLQLQQTLTGYPAAGVQYLVLGQDSFLVWLRLLKRSLCSFRLIQLYPSADAVIILNAHTLVLVRVLAFWEAFPGLLHSKEEISCISVDSGMKLVRFFVNPLNRGLNGQ